MIPSRPPPQPQEVSSWFPLHRRRPEIDWSNSASLSLSGRTRRGGRSWKPALCSEDTAKELLASKAAKALLPRVTNVFSCPIAVINREGEFKVRSKGYHAEGNGIFVADGAVGIGVLLCLAYDPALSDQFRWGPEADKA